MRSIVGVGKIVFTGVNRGEKSAELFLEDF
jgi:hypothetical protein